MSGQQFDPRMMGPQGPIDLGMIPDQKEMMVKQERAGALQLAIAYLGQPESSVGANQRLIDTAKAIFAYLQDGK